MYEHLPIIANTLPQSETLSPEAPPNTRGKSSGLSDSAQGLSTTLATPNGRLETIHNIDTLVNRLDPDSFVDKVPGLEKRGTFGGFWGKCALFSSGLAFLRVRSSVKTASGHSTSRRAPSATGLGARQTDPRREAGLLERLNHYSQGGDQWIPTTSRAIQRQGTSVTEATEGWVRPSSPLTSSLT